MPKECHLCGYNLHLKVCLGVQLFLGLFVAEFVVAYQREGLVLIHGFHDFVVLDPESWGCRINLMSRHLELFIADEEAFPRKSPNRFLINLVFLHVFNY